MKVLDFAPFRGSYVREFELSHSNLVNRIIKITHAHNLHVKMLIFGPFTIRKRQLKRGKLFNYKIFSNDFKKSPRLYCVSCNVKVDSLTFINFQENYQTAEIYFYLYDVTPLNRTVSNYCVN